jgi:hypothetical protein
LVLKKQIVLQRKQQQEELIFTKSVKTILKTKNLNWDDYQPLTKFMFYHAKPYLDKINNIHAIERTLYSEYLGLQEE